MGSVGDCFDNALYESFFATLECELLKRHSFRTPADARRVVFGYIEDGTIPIVGILLSTTSRRLPTSTPIKIGLDMQTQNYLLKRGNSNAT